MGTYGELWEPMGAYGDLWGRMGTYGDLWEPMGVYGDLWAPMGAYGDLLVPMGTYWGLWGPIGAYGLTRGFHCSPQPLKAGIVATALVRRFMEFSMYSQRCIIAGTLVACCVCVLIPVRPPV